MDGEHYLDNARQQFRKLRQMAEKALAQVDDAQFFAQLDPGSNSLAIIVKHIAGNALSRWTDFLTADGEKPGRRRDTEFEIEPGDTRATLMERWAAGWQALDAALGPLTAADLERSVVIRGEPHSVVEALQRQLTHYSYHVGQMVYLARHYAGENWQTLSIPRGQSEPFNQAVREQAKAETK